MPGQAEGPAWFLDVYKLVQKIPPGKVTTYKHLAALLGIRPQQVGQALKALPGAKSGEPYRTDNVHWRRIITAKGELPYRGKGSQAEHQKILEGEGITVRNDDWADYYVDKQVFGWFPSKDEIAVGNGEDGGEDENGNGG